MFPFLYTNGNAQFLIDVIFPLYPYLKKLSLILYKMSFFVSVIIHIFTSLEVKKSNYSSDSMNADVGR